MCASCGEFSSCNEESLPSCNFLPGFEPKSQSDWDLQAYSGGCSRITSIAYCRTTISSANYRAVDGFQEIHSM